MLEAGDYPNFQITRGSNGRMLWWEATMPNERFTLRSYEGDDPPKTANAFDCRLRDATQHMIKKFERAFWYGAPPQPPPSWWKRWLHRLMFWRHHG